MGELSTGDLGHFEVYRTGARVMLRCERCKYRWPWPSKVGLLKLVRVARSHVCDDSIASSASKSSDVEHV